jgi:hypothetical protein
LRSGRTGGAFGAVRTSGTSVASDARLATKEHEEIKASARRNARGDRGRKSLDRLVTQSNNVRRGYANAAHRDAVDDRAGILELTHDSAARTACLGRNADRLVGPVERRHDRCEAIAICIRDRDDNTGVDAIDHRARDIANETAVADASRAARAVDDDRIARVLENESHSALREGGGR